MTLLQVTDQNGNHIGLYTSEIIKEPDAIEIIEKIYKSAGDQERADIELEKIFINRVVAGEVFVDV